MATLDDCRKCARVTIDLFLLWDKLIYKTIPVHSIYGYLSVAFMCTHTGKLSYLVE